MQNRRKALRRRIVIRQEQLSAIEKGDLTLCGNPLRRIPTDSRFAKPQRLQGYFASPFSVCAFFTA
jgi:hypothetical protein